MSSSVASAPAASADTPDCALCERKATSRCSVCKNIWFCGSQCQATLWPVHKKLCTADQSIFRQAPLTKSELVDFNSLADGAYNFHGGAPPEMPPMPLKLTFAGATGVEDWSRTLSLLVSPVTDPTPTYDFDDVREDTIAMARTQLSAKYDYTNEHTLPAPPETTPWIEMALCITTVGVAYGWVIAQDDEECHGTARFIKELNEFLRQSLIQCTVNYHVLKATSVPDVIPWLPLLFLARDRAVAALDRSGVDPRIIGRLRPPLVAKYEDLRSLAVGPDGRLPPAVHP
ncbi:hypothetical protein JCM10908_005779 [Rhodotorula pacifica]|uniref:zinc finger MYND domain-containing protein n=1 Tax=Rhodotorula pacifica TaxID=1495444 RepID=UPI00317A6C8C